MASITRELLPNSAPDVFVEPPFLCDYGKCFTEKTTIISFTFSSDVKGIVSKQ